MSGLGLSRRVVRVRGGIRWASTTTATRTDDTTKQRIVILGSGWAGYALARTLSPSLTSRILISPRSHFVFTPLLASTSVGTLEFRSAIEPVRRLGLAEFHQGWATGVDFARKRVRVEANLEGDVGARTGAASRRQEEGGKGPEYEVEYDKLVLAVGCYSQTFGIEGVKEHACFLRDIGDARDIRLRVLEAFERACMPLTGEAERRRLLHFVVVGGGPTGIEFAAELHDLVRDDLARLYPQLAPHVRITIYDVAPKVLPMFDRSLAAYAAEVFRRQGISVKTEHRLERIRRDGSTLMLRVREEPEEVGAGLVVWSTGLMQNPLVGRLLDGEMDLGGGSDKGGGGSGEGGGGGGGTMTKIAKDPKTGGIVTDAHLRVQLQNPDGKTTTTLPDVYAMGDCAVVQEQRYPATAQVANQQAVYLGKQLNKRIISRGKKKKNQEEEEEEKEVAAMKPFKFRNLGVMAYLGSRKAIHQSRADELKGWPAWILWRTAYLTRSMSVRNKIMIQVHWLITWLFGRDISRF